MLTLASVGSEGLNRYMSSHVNTYMSSLISPIPATMIAVAETVPYTLLGITVAMTSDF